MSRSRYIGVEEVSPIVDHVLMVCVDLKLGLWQSLLTVPIQAVDDWDSNPVEGPPSVPLQNTEYDMPMSSSSVG